MTLDQAIEAMNDAENIREAATLMRDAERSLEDAVAHIEGVEEPPAESDDPAYLANLKRSCASLLNDLRTRRKSFESAQADYGVEFTGFATECLLYPAGDRRLGDNVYLLDVLETQGDQMFRFVIEPDDSGFVTEVLVEKAWKPDTGKSLDAKNWAVNTALAWNNQVGELVEEMGWQFPDGRDAEQVLTFSQDIE